MASEREEKRKRLEAELRGLSVEDQHHAWAEKLIAPYTPTERYRLLDHLVEWSRSQKGHRPDCSCGECE